MAVKNEILPFVATGTDLEIITLSEPSHATERPVSHDIAFMWSLKK